MSETKPREFWIERFGGMQDTYFIHLVKPNKTIVYVDETIHVVEKSALDQAQARIAELEAKCADLEQAEALHRENYLAQARIADQAREKAADYERVLELIADDHFVAEYAIELRKVKGFAKSALEKWRK